LARITPTFTYRHMMRYPNLVCSTMNLFHTYWTVVPVGPDETRELIWTFSNCGAGGRLRSGLVEWILKRWVTRFSERVRDEDAAIIPTIHRGIAAADRPVGGGLISRREERIFAFEKFVLQETDATPARTAEPAAGAARPPAAQTVPWFPQPTPVDDETLVPRLRLGTHERDALRREISPPPPEPAREKQEHR
jgi:hypothetical protein